MLADVASVEPPEAPSNKSDDTNLSSPGGVGENSSGWGEPGEAKVKLYLTDAQFAALLAYRQSGVNLCWLERYALIGGQANPTMIFWIAWIASLKINAAEKLNDDKQMVEMTLQMTGDVSFFAGT